MSINGKSGIFNRYFILLFITSVCFCTATEMNNVVLPLYMTEDLGGTAAAMGQVDWLLVGSAAALSGILSLLTSVAGLPEVKTE